MINDIVVKSSLVIDGTDGGVQNESNPAHSAH